MHGTLGMISLSWKFNFKQLLCKTLNSRMNIIETRAVSKKTKMGSWGQTGGLGIRNKKYESFANFEMCENYSSNMK